MLSIFLLVAASILTYLYAIKPFNFWKARNVKASKGIPFFGESLWIVLGLESFVDQMLRIYDLFPNERYFGFYLFSNPLILVKSPDLIRQICMVDYDHFVNRLTLVPDHVDDLFTRNSMSMKGQEWKDSRSYMTPAYTSSKMKAMFTSMSENADKLVNHFLEKDQEVVEVEFKDVLSRLANDCIANNVYGLHVDSLKDKSNTFYEMAKIGCNLNGYRKKYSILFYQLAPKISAFFRLSFTGKEIEHFFVKLTRDIMDLRKTNRTKRPDLIGLLIGSRKEEIELISTKTMKETKKDLSVTDITALAFFSFIAGFEGVSNVICLILYQLALNPDIQKRLVEEMEGNFVDGEMPSYGEIMNLTYMDMVVSEALRMYPFLLSTDRITTKKYTIQPEKPGEKPLTLEPGTPVLIPIAGLHKDPRYFKNPHKFDPERFSPENRKNIHPCTYLPFGLGPRLCMGNRFSLMEIKVVLFKILTKFEIVPVERTQVPMKMDKQAFGYSPVGGYHLGLKRRNL